VVGLRPSQVIAAWRLLAWRAGGCVVATGLALAQAMGLTPLVVDVAGRLLRNTASSRTCFCPAAACRRFWLAEHP